MTENYLEYGTCKACNENTIFRYIGPQPEIEGSPGADLYDCLRCNGTFELSNLEKKVKTI